MRMRKGAEGTVINTHTNEGAQWRSQRNLTSPALIPTHSRGVRGKNAPPENFEFQKSGMAKAKGTSKNCVISGKFLIIFIENIKLFEIHFFIIFHYIFFNLTENVAKYSQITKEENIMYTIRVCNTIIHLINT